MLLDRACCLLSGALLLTAWARPGSWSHLRKASCSQSRRGGSCQLGGSISSVSISIRQAASALSASAVSASGWKHRQADGSRVSVVSRMAASTAFVSSAASSQGCSVGFVGSIFSRVAASTASSAGWHHQQQRSGETLTAVAVHSAQDTAYSRQQQSAPALGREASVFLDMICRARSGRPPLDAR